MMNNIIINADDFGISKEVNNAIMAVMDFKEVLSGKRQKATKPVLSNSLMPYTFDQKMSNLICFLNLDAA